MTKEDDDNAIDNAVFKYADPDIVSGNAPIPRWLKFNYVLWPLWGIVWWYLFWNGSYGWFDRGYWKELEVAANTTFPIVNQYEVPEIPEKSEKVAVETNYKVDHLSE